MLKERCFFCGSMDIALYIQKEHRKIPVCHVCWAAVDEDKPLQTMLNKWLEGCKV